MQYSRVCKSWPPQENPRESRIWTGQPERDPIIRSKLFRFRVWVCALRLAGRGIRSSLRKTPLEPVTTRRKTEPNLTKLSALAGMRGWSVGWYGGQLTFQIKYKKKRVANVCRHAVHTFLYILFKFLWPVTHFWAASALCLCDPRWRYRKQCNDNILIYVRLICFLSECLYYYYCRGSYKRYCCVWVSFGELCLRFFYQLCRTPIRWSNQWRGCFWNKCQSLESEFVDQTFLLSNTLKTKK